MYIDRRMELLYRLAEFWPHAVAVLTLFSAGLASAHAVLHKRDTRATVLWIGFIWLLPLLGPVLYLLLGVNRVRRKAQLLRGATSRAAGSGPSRTIVRSCQADRALSAGGGQQSGAADQRRRRLSGHAGGHWRGQEDDRLLELYF